jgi:hypothetical protein
MNAYVIDQQMVNLPTITFGQLNARAKSAGVDLKATFRNEVPADVLDRIALPRYAANVCPYTALIEWYGTVGTKPCPCGCMARVGDRQRFHCPTCRVRYEIMRDRGKDPGPRRNPKMPPRKCA